MLFHFREHTIQYERFGSGPELLFCLHGYGESGNSFEYLSAGLGARFTLVCPELPLHGMTRWEAPAFHPGDLQELLLALAERERPGTGQWSLAGYSMGGRLCLALAEKFPETVNRLYLVAPDGMKLNFWYWLTTQTGWGNRLFRYTMEHPSWLFRAMRWARKSGLLNQSIYKFSHHYLDDPHQRMALYNRWTMFRSFRPDHKRLNKVLKEKGTRVVLFIGKFDRIITIHQAMRFRQMMGDITDLHILEAGHRLLKPPIATTIAKKIIVSLT